MGEAKKGPLPVVSPVASTNIGISPQNFQTFIFNSFVTLVLTSIPSASTKLLNLNRDDLSKKCFFGSNPYKIEVMITSLTEMLELPNFGHMMTSTI